MLRWRFFGRRNAVENEGPRRSLLRAFRPRGGNYHRVPYLFGTRRAEIGSSSLNRYEVAFDDSVAYELTPTQGTAADRYGRCPENDDDFQSVHAAWHMMCHV